MAEQENFFLNFLLRAEDQASHVVAGFGGKIGTVAHDAQLAIGALGLAALGATTAAVKMAEDFDIPMRKVFALTGISRDQFEAYKEQVLDLSTVVPKSAEDLANGLYFVVSAGFQGSDAMKILEASAKAASAGLTDTKTVADAITSALNAYKLTGKDAGDITGKLTQAVIEGKTEFGALAGSIGRVLPIAAAAGVSFDEVMASMATMTRVGLNADEAATALRGVLNALEKPTSKAADEMTHLGLFMDGATFSGDKLRAALKERGLLSVLQELMTATHGNVGELGEIIPNIRALTGVLATAGSQAEQYAGILGREKASGAAAANEAFSRTAEGLAVQSALLKNNLAAIGITVGEVLLPPLIQMTSQIAEVVKGVREWMKENPQMAEWISKGLAAVAVFGTLAGGAATLGAAIGFVGTHLGGLFLGVSAVSHGLLAFLGPIGLAIAAGLALKVAWDNDFLGIQERTAGAFSAIQESVGTFVALAWQYISPFVDAAMRELGKFWTEVQPKIEAAWNAISTAVQFYIQNVLMPVVSALADFWDTHWRKIVEVLQDVWNVITDVIRVAWDIISGLFKVWLDVISGNWKGAWDDLNQMVKNVFGDMGRFLRDFLLNLVPTLFGLAVDLAGAIGSGLVAGLGNAKTAVGNAIGTLAGSMIDGFKSFFGISSPSLVAGEIGGNITLGLASGILGGTDAVTGAVGTLAEKLGLSLNAGLTTAMQNAQLTLQQQIANLVKALPTTTGVVAAPPPGAPTGSGPSVNIGGIASAINAQVGSVIQTIGGIQYSLSAAAIARGGIPGFAAGLDAGPMLYDGLAFLHRGERVVRADQERRASSEPVIHRVQVFLSGKQIADAVSEQWTTGARLAGRSLG